MSGATGRGRMSAKVDALPTSRRLRALAAIGHPASELGNLIGIHPDDVARIASGRRSRVGDDIAEAVATVYARLCQTPGPSQHARNRAARAGYLPPATWDADSIDGGNHRGTEPPGVAADAAYAALMRQLLVEQYAPRPPGRYDAPVTAEQARKNRADLASACRGYADERAAAESCPTGKVRFVSEGAATHALAQSITSMSPRRRERRMYRCEQCGDWHLPSRSSWSTA